jgi:hypothetical protein
MKDRTFLASEAKDTSVRWMAHPAQRVDRCFLV